MTTGRILALDVGDRRIGLAITDPGNMLALPLFTVHRTTLRADLKSIARFIRQHGVSTLVVGYPLHADGSESPQSAKTVRFAEILIAEHPNLSHHMLDERLTTAEAHALLNARGSRRTAQDRLTRQEQIDQVAATLILQSYLDRENGPALLPDPDSE